MTDSLERTELVVRTIAQTAIDNEKYFGDLDAVVGDGDFGYSLARGWEKVLEGWDDIDRSDTGTFLKKTGMIVTSRIGGTSGPIWGTAFMRAGALSKDRTTITLDDLDKMLTAAIEGIQKRGGAQLGDKTLLDSLIPIRDLVHEHAGKPDANPSDVLVKATAVANDAIERTKPWVAKRGRQQFTGDRSKDTPDPGIVAIATMMNDLCTQFGVANRASGKN